MGFAGSQARAGLFFRGHREQKQRIKGLSIDFLHQAGCNACPLNNVRGNKNPHMKPYGTEEPVVYILGEAPGEIEDRKGRPFVGPAGELLKWRMPEGWDDYIRWSNVVRTRPPDNRNPDPVEIECCRPSIEEDIARTKPRAIFGFGNFALEWATKQTGIMKWCQRRIPVKVRDHVCWFYPIIHPAAILNSPKRKFEPKYLDQYSCQEEFVFQLNLDWAFGDVEHAPDPVVHSEADALQGIEWVTGNGKDDLDRVIDFLDIAKESEVSGADYETNAVRPWKEGAKILTASVSCDKGTLSFPFEHPGAGWTDRQLRVLEDEWVNYLTHANRVAVHQAAFEMEWTAVIFGLDLVHGVEWDCTKGQAYVLDERQGMLSLEAKCIEHFGINVKAIANTDTLNLERTPLETVLRYNGLDAKYHRLLCIEQDARLVADDLWQVYIEHVRRIKAAVLTQIKGVPVDEKVVAKFLLDYTEKMENAEDELFDIPEVVKFRNKKGEEFKPGSSHDAANMLHKLGFHDFESTDEKELEKIDHPFAEALVKWRKPAKAVATYIAPLMRDHEKTVVHSDGLLHPILSCDKTVTWRSSAEDPNIQNFHKRSEMVELRKQVKARPGRKIVSFDYAGIQARNVAMESKDKVLIEAFWNDYDIHADWLEKIMKVYPDFADGKKLAKDKDYFKAQRHRAKNKFVFPAFFGAQENALSYHLQIPDKPCAELREWFFDEFHEIESWHKKLHSDYYKYGYVTGLSGFRRRAPTDPNQIINAPIQADESIIVFDAMERLSQIDFDLYVANLMVHDDLTFEWYDEEIDENAETVVKTMIYTPYEWAHIVPIEVEMSIGDDWGSVKEVAKFTSKNWNGIVEIKK